MSDPVRIVMHCCDTCAYYRDVGAYYQFDPGPRRFDCVHPNRMTGHKQDWFGCADWDLRVSEEPVSNPLK